MDVWATLGARLDPGRTRPRLAPGVELRVFPAEGHAVALAPSTGTVLRLTLWQHRLLVGMDGRADLHALARLAGRLRGGSVRWSGADRPVRWLYRHGLGLLLLRPPALAGAAVLAVVGLLGFLRVHASGGPLAPAPAVTVALLVVLDLAAGVLHEFGHALVLVHQGRRVRAAGARFYYGTPAFFVDASEALLLGRRGRIVQAAAGIMTELVLAGAAGLALWLDPAAPLAPVLYQFAVLTYLSVLLNLTPLLELDGYWILADALGRPDLRRRSWRALTGLARSGPRGPGEVALAAYGLAGILFGAALLAGAAVFWLDVFGAPVAALWDSGPLGRLLVAAAAAVLVAGRVVGVGGAAWAALRAGARRLRFRAERRWRVRAAELIDALPGLGDLPEDELGELAGRLERRRYRHGQVVYELGTGARRLHVVGTGTVELVDAGGRVVATAGPGAAFGADELRDGMPRRTTARASGSGTLFELDRGGAERLLAAAPVRPSPGRRSA